MMRNRASATPAVPLAAHMPRQQPLEFDIDSSFSTMNPSIFFFYILPSAFLISVPLPAFVCDFLSFFFLKSPAQLMQSFDLRLLHPTHV